MGGRQARPPAHDRDDRPAGRGLELDDDLVVPFDRDRFDGAPDIDPDVELTEEQERALHEHYGHG